jgi:hypothetical protein
VKKVAFAQSWVLVTGASSGLGAEFARQLAHRGANLVLTGRSLERMNQLAQDLERVNGVRTHTLAADLSEASGVRTLLEGVDALGVPIEHVVNNAGFGAVGSFVEVDAASQTRMVRVNVEAVTAIARHFLPRMVAAGRGGLIQVASTAAHQPTPYMATYSATKAYVLSLSLALAEEVRPAGVRVLALCPGPTPTNFQQTAGIPRSRWMPLLEVQVGAVVEAALDGYDAGRRVVTPGALNSVQTTAVKLLPNSVVVRAARWAMHGLGRS